MCKIIQNVKMCVRTWSPNRTLRLKVLELYFYPKQKRKKKVKE